MIGVKPIEGYNFPAGVGYIALPSDIKRDLYIAQCLKTSTVSIRCEDGGFFNRVPIDATAINFIEFPLTTSTSGTTVLYINEPVKNQLFIVAILNPVDNIQDIVEGQFKFKRTLKDAHVEIAGSAKDEYIGITVKGTKNGQAYINISNDSKTGKLNVEVSGDINLSSTNNTTLSSINQTTIGTTKDNNGQDLPIQQSTFIQTPTLSQFQNKKFTINSGKEPMALAQTLKDILDDFIDQVANITVFTGDAGIQSIINQQTVQALKKRTQGILSQVGFLE